MAAIMNSSVDKMNIFLQCDYYNGSHLAKLDQSDDRKITIHLRKLVVNHNYHKKKSITGIKINQLQPTDETFEPTEESLCFLRGLLVLTEVKKNLIVAEKQTGLSSSIAISKNFH